MAKLATSQPKKTAPSTTDRTANTTTQAEIERLAYQFFVERGYEHGHQDEDWLRAESIIKNRKRS